MKNNSVKYLFRADYDYNGGNIECKDSNSDASLRVHLQSGSAQNIKTKYISMTQSIGIAAYHYALGDKKNPREDRAPVVLIDYTNIPDTDDQNRTREFYNSSTDENKSITGRPLHFAKAAQEVVTSYSIPEECLKEIPPILVDIIYAFEYNDFNLATQREENGIVDDPEITKYKSSKISEKTQKYIQELLCDLVFSEDYSEITNLLTQKIPFNDIEKKFMEKYYDIDFENGGNILRKDGKHLPKLETVTQTTLTPYLKEKFGSKYNSYSFTDPDISHYVRGQIVNNIIENSDFRNLLIKQHLKHIGKEDISQCTSDERSTLENIKNTNITKSQYLGIVEGKYNQTMSKDIYASYQKKPGCMLPGGLYVAKKPEMKNTEHGYHSFKIPYGMSYITDENGNVEGLQAIYKTIESLPGERNFKIDDVIARTTKTNKDSIHELIESLGMTFLHKADSIDSQKRVQLKSLTTGYIKSNTLNQWLGGR